MVEFMQRVKDAEVLKCWRRRMRGLQQDSIWKSVPEHLRPGTAHYTMTNEPHGTGDAPKKEHIFQKAQVTLNKNAHNLQHHFGAQFFMVFHMV